MFEPLCVVVGRVSELVSKRRKGGGGHIERERKREGASGSDFGIPLKHCSLSFASLRKQGSPSYCLLTPSSPAALP